MTIRCHVIIYVTSIPCFYSWNISRMITGKRKMREVLTKISLRLSNWAIQLN
jgi:hypothetical protein